MYINRKLEKIITKYLKTPEILAIVGPRQAGKTTLIKHIQIKLQNSVYLSFEDMETLELFEKDINSFLALYKGYKYLIIDEFQYSKNGGKLLKYIYDNNPGKKIIISGSSAIDITINAVKYLAGRVFVLNLFQLDFDEYLSFKNKPLYKLLLLYKLNFSMFGGRYKPIDATEIINKRLYKYLIDFITWGGYPRIALAKDNDEKKIILKNIYNTYFLRDIRDVIGLTDDFKLSRLIQILALQNGQLISYNDLSLHSSYDHNTLKKYLNILEKTFICSFIKPYSTNKKNEIIKNPKVYFYDTGLRNSIIDNFSTFELRTEKGFLLENYIYSQLQKNNFVPKFWRTKNMAEVDFVIEQDTSLIAIESKSRLIEEKIERSVYSFIEKYSPEKVLILNSNIIIRSNKRKEIFFYPHWII